ATDSTPSLGPDGSADETLGEVDAGLASGSLDSSGTDATDAPSPSAAWLIYISPAEADFAGLSNAFADISIIYSTILGFR
ncbi:hypothetical protein ACFQE1_21685, partial [Halobium palmae]